MPPYRLAVADQEHALSGEPGFPMSPAAFHEAAIGYALQAWDAWEDGPRQGRVDERAAFEALVRERLAQLATLYAGALDERSSK